MENGSDIKRPLLDSPANSATAADLIQPQPPQLTNAHDLTPATPPYSQDVHNSFAFSAATADIGPIKTPRDFFREFSVESKKLWYLAGPAIFTTICQYSLGAITQLLAGHVGTIQLAAVSVENSVIAGFSFGIMLGMGSALETLCGQAFGAGQIDMLGIYMQRSWVILGMAYILSGTCGRAWNGFSIKAFQNLWGFVRLSLASAVMLCLEVWYFMALILFAGYLKNAEVSVDALSVCMNILGWTIMVAIGMNAAISVRVSNELGGGHPRTAKFSLVVAVVSSFLVGLAISAILLATKNEYPLLFSEDTNVDSLVEDLTPVLCFCIVIDNIQPVLSGVAVGAGWQAVVAYVNIACYYVLGVPLGLILGYKLGWGVRGIWYGMLLGTLVQTLVLFIMISRTNWNKEASIAEDRIKKWGGDNPEVTDSEK
ncbi:hypothetical protein MLD38_017032 [Melastoma candidum]|uniref:Uncharacterized protein n=1 Tax=Melastoma candidum TaxID=119954 RepID=A0ACB9QQL7_9MYRT|nr:hypothetical protein MLD38_017032 [Melastoma candidum]